ncbi:hypothetical protein RLIN73S_01632 [Rhodanobacter lindaniclasticus]
MPKKVLLIDSDDAKVGKKHLQFLARVAIDYHFGAYFFDSKGRLTEISPVEHQGAQAGGSSRPRADVERQSGRRQQSLRSVVGALNAVAR